MAVQMVWTGRQSSTTAKQLNAAMYCSWCIGSIRTLMHNNQAEAARTAKIKDLEVADWTSASWRFGLCISAEPKPDSQRNRNGGKNRSPKAQTPAVWAAS